VLPALARDCTICIVGANNLNQPSKCCEAFGHRIGQIYQHISARLTLNIGA
jgi:hypothetical protein